MAFFNPSHVRNMVDMVGLKTTFSISVLQYISME